MATFLDSIARSPNSLPGMPISMTPDLNFTGMPGFRGPQGMMLQMILQPLLQQLLGPGFTAGPFQPTHNFYDHYRRRLEFQQMQQSMAGASATDEQTFLQMIRGMAAMRGVAWNADRDRAARIWASDFGRVAPMFAQMMPGTFDQAMGTRGSSIVGSQAIFSGGRYLLDPVAGTLGYSPQTASTFSREIFDRLYGPGANLAAMHGVGMGSAGMMFEELARRGALPRTLTRDEQLRGIASQTERGRGGDIAGAIGDLQRLDSPQLEARIRQFEAGRHAQRLQGLSGAVAAMREIFGEAGQPDAPFYQLIEGIEVLTQGGLSRMAPQRIQQVVRDFANTARQTGLGIDRLTAMSAAAGNQADAMGLDRGFGVNAAIMAGHFGQAYGGMAGGSPAWGRADARRMEALDMRLRLNAADSPVASQLAATMRLGADVGFRPGSEAAALYQALQGGQTTYNFGGTSRSVYDRDRWRSVMQRGGVDMSLASAYRGDTAYNQRTIDEFGLGEVARNLQGRLDIAPRIGRAYTTGARQAGITNPALLARLSGLAAQGLLEGLSVEQLQDPDAMASFLGQRLGVSDARSIAQLRMASIRGWSNWEQAVRRNPGLSGYRTGDQAILAHRNQILTAAGAGRDEARIAGRLQDALGGLGSGMMARVIDSILGAGPNTSIRELGARALGWFPEGEVGDALATTLQDIRGEIQAYSGAPGGASGRAIRERALERLRQFSPQFLRQADAAGLGRGPVMAAGERQRVGDALRALGGIASPAASALQAAAAVVDHASASPAPAAGATAAGPNNIQIQGTLQIIGQEAIIRGRGGASP